MTTFTVAGVSLNKGKVKVRFCSDKVLRVKNLQKQGDTEINLIDLPNPMTKAEACAYLIASGLFSDYNKEIAEIQRSKEANTTQSKVSIAKVTAPVETVDSEIEELKELVAA